MKTFKITLLLMLVTLFWGSIFAVTVKVQNSVGEPLVGAILEWSTDIEFTTYETKTPNAEGVIIIVSDSPEVYVRVIYNKNISEITEMTSTGSDEIIATAKSTVQVINENDEPVIGTLVEFSANGLTDNPLKITTDVEGMAVAELFPGKVKISTIINSEIITRIQHLVNKSELTAQIIKNGDIHRITSSFIPNFVIISNRRFKWTGDESTSWNNEKNWIRISPMYFNLIKIPIDGDNIEFDVNAVKNLILEEDHKIGDFINNSSVQLVIPANLSLTVGGVITTNSEERILIKSKVGEPNGTFIFLQNDNTPVKAIVEMYSKASKVGEIYKWQFFGVPLKSTTINSIYNGETPKSYVRQMYETGTNDSDHWVQKKRDDLLTPFTGYEITQHDTTTIRFKGDLVSSDFNLNRQKLSFTTGAQYSGQHLIGNPYTAAINFYQIEFGSSMEKTVYLYNTGSYSEWQSHETTQEGIGAGQYIAIPRFLGNVGYGIPNQIPSMQAFLVKVKNQFSPNKAWISIKYKYTDKNIAPQRAPAVKKVLTMIDVKGKRFSDRLWIFTENHTTHNFDNGWDGIKFLGLSSAPQIFAMEKDGDYQINTVDNINNTEIGFQTGEDTHYTLVFTQQSLETRYNSLYLIDLVENKTIDITQNGTEYTFTAMPTDVPVKRFKIVTKSDALANLPSVIEKNIKIFSSQQNIFIKNISNEKGDIRIYDLSGRCIIKMPFNANGITNLPINLSSGTYIAKGITRDEETTTNLIIR